MSFASGLFRNFSFQFKNNNNFKYPGDFLLCYSALPMREETDGSLMLWDGEEPCTSASKTPTRGRKTGGTNQEDRNRCLAGDRSLNSWWPPQFLERRRIRRFQSTRTRNSVVSSERESARSQWSMELRWMPINQIKCKNRLKSNHSLSDIFSLKPEEPLLPEKFLELKTSRIIETDNQNRNFR